MFSALDLTNDILTYPEMSTATESDKIWLSTLIAAFSNRVESYTGRLFEKVARTRVFSCETSQSIIQLPAYNEREGGGSVSAVYESSDQDFVASNLISSEDYYYDSYSGLLQRKNNVWTAGRNTVQVTWTDGYQNVPSDIRMAGILQVMFWYQNRSKIAQNEVRMSQGGVVKTSSGWALIPEVQQILNSYSVSCV